MYLQSVVKYTFVQTGEVLYNFKVKIMYNAYFFNNSKFRKKYSYSNMRNLLRSVAKGFDLQNAKLLERKNFNIKKEIIFK